MFQHPRSGNRAIFGHMAYHQQCNIMHLGGTDQFLCGGAYLADGAGRGIKAGQIHRLDGIDHHNLRTRRPAQRCGNITGIGGGRQIDRCITKPQPARPHAHLIG